MNESWVIHWHVTKFDPCVNSLSATIGHMYCYYWAWGNTEQKGYEGQNLSVYVWGGNGLNQSTLNIRGGILHHAGLKESLCLSRTLTHKYIEPGGSKSSTPIRR